MQSLSTDKKIPMSSHDSDTTRYLRFFAKGAVLISAPSFLWTSYICYSYPINPLAASLRIAICLVAIVVGAMVLTLTASQVPRQACKKDRKSWIGSRIDGLLFFLLLPALLISVFLLSFGVNNYINALSVNGNYIPVKVHVESIETKHVSEEELPDESFIELFKEVYFIPDHYSDLWIAVGNVTVLERNSESIEPYVSRAIFTVPHFEHYGGKNGKTYLEHYKMDAVRDSDRFKVGQAYDGWILRDRASDVFFVRSSDIAHKNLNVLGPLFVALCVYLIARILIGMRLQDKHWVDLKSILTRK